MSDSVDGGPLQAIQQLLHPGRLFSLEPRRVLLEAARFARMEPQLRQFSLTRGDQPLRVSILSSLSAQHFISVLKLFLYAERTVPEFYLGSFDGITIEGGDPTAPVWSSAPDVLILLPAIDDIKSWPRMFAGRDEIEAWVCSCAQRYLDVWRRAVELLPGCRVYHCLFAPPIERPLGNLERAYPFSRTNCLAALNGHLLDHRAPNVTLVDMEALSGWVGRRQWLDEAAYFTSKQPFSLREMPLLAGNLSRLIMAARGAVRKCLVVDLDNTLWGGVIGDDGVEGIRLDPNDGVGEAYLAFQRYLLALKDRGVLLAVCSKNDSALARSAFERHPDILLRLDDFAAFIANWDDKHINLRRVAEQLNIGTNALVFFDDNPAERALVRQFEPDVLVIDVPEDPALYVRALDTSFAFEWPELTAEDLGRADSYVQNRKREELEQQYGSYDDFLNSLEMRISIEPTDSSSLTRVCQLVNKTNQFNLRTRRYGEDDLIRLLGSPDYQLLHVRLRDRFTNFGIVASIVVRFMDEFAFIENWVMSCRVFKRGVEDATFNAIVNAARLRGARWLVAEYRPTEKNVYVAGFLERLSLIKWALRSDFPALPKDIDGEAAYVGFVGELLPRHHFIKQAA